MSLAHTKRNISVVKEVACKIIFDLIKVSDEDKNDGNDKNDAVGSQGFVVGSVALAEEVQPWNGSRLF